MMTLGIVALICAVAFIIELATVIWLSSKEEK